MKTNLLDQPRCSGKTTRLKLYAHENAQRFDDICIMGHSHSSTDGLVAYARTYISALKHQRVHNSIDTMRAIRQSKILVLIDEPFLMEDEQQSRIIDMLEILELRNTIEVYGIGTRPTVSPFDKFLKDCK